MARHTHPRTSRRPEFPARTGAVVLLFIAGAIAAGAFAMPNEWKASTLAAIDAVPTSKEEPKGPVAEHVKTPEPLKGIYMSQCVVGTPSFREQLVKLIDETELNAVVIDIKDYTGKIGFQTDNPALKDSVSDKCGARDMRDFVKSLHEKGIYVIGRITVFQDPHYTKLHPEQSVQSKSRPGEPWKDHKGLSFISPLAKPYWEYVVELSKESYEVMGFDELNYDYIRWPSDGPMSDVVYPNVSRAQAIEEFWKHLRASLKDTGLVMSADLFGMVTTNTDDLNIGQQLERALPHFDYIMPMMYPSHYPKGWNGLSNPNLFPYEVIQYAMSAAARRTQATETPVPTLAGVPIASTSPQLYTKESYSPLKQRPWLQDFDYGKDYTEADIKAQVKGTYDSGLTSWIFWDPANKYESLRRALANEDPL